MVLICLIVPARRAKARNVLWKASSTSCCRGARTANSKDHRTVALDQDPESVRVVRGDETLQKLPIRHCTKLLERPYREGRDVRRWAIGPSSPRSAGGTAEPVGRDPH